MLWFFKQKKTLKYWDLMLEDAYISFFVFFKINLFIYFWLRWVFVAARGLSLVALSEGYFSLQCAGFSLRWLLLLQSTGSSLMGSVVVAHGL